MRRRYKILIAIIIPVVLIYGLGLTETPLFKWFIGYIIAIAVLFKTTLLSLWLTTKLKLLAFLKGLTIVQGLYLLMKRWLLDNVIIKWFKTDILAHFVDGFKELKAFYLHLNFRAKLKHLWGILLFAGVAALWGYISGSMNHLLLFTQIKLIAAALFQGIVTYSTKAITMLLSWFTSSWIAPLLQLFALSYLLTLIERKFGKEHPLSRLLDRIGSWGDRIFYYIDRIKEKLLTPVHYSSQKAGARLYALVKQKKIKEEFLYMERFENTILQGHIDAYYAFKDMEKITDKRELYRRINQKTKDNIEIVAYVSRNSQGKLLEESVPDSYYHDVFLIESFASHQKYGVQHYDIPQNPTHIDHTDFWVLNTSAFPIRIGSQSNNFPTQCIPGHGLALIQTKHPFSYAEKDVYVMYEDEKVYVTPVER